ATLRYGGWAWQAGIGPAGALNWHPEIDRSAVPVGVPTRKAAKWTRLKVTDALLLDYKFQVLSWELTRFKSSRLPQNFQPFFGHEVKQLKRRAARSFSALFPLLNCRLAGIQVGGEHTLTCFYT